MIAVTWVSFSVLQKFNIAIKFRFHESQVIAKTR